MDNVVSATLDISLKLPQSKPHAGPAVTMRQREYLDPMLQVLELVKDYRGGKDWIRAVNQVSFEVRPGEIVGILGPNGAGKTTAIRCIAGILRPTAGQVLINGYDLVSHDTLAKQRLAFVPEVPALYDLLTVEEHMRFVAMCFNTLPQYERDGDMLLERYSLKDKKDELVATLSKGMKQKLSVACALIHEANVFLFDEPLIGIDPAGAAAFKQELRDIRNRGGCVLISTHLLDTAEKLCDRVVIFKRGTVIFQGTVEELRATSQTKHENLEDLFLDLTNETPV